MKKFLCILMAFTLLYVIAGCSVSAEAVDIAATTLPVYQFTTMLCQGTNLRVARLVTENVSCLHDYALSVKQVKTVESAELIIMNGAGLEDFMEDLLTGKPTIDASEGIALLESCHHHEHNQSHDDHHHEHDAHIWLSPANAIMMAENICHGLKSQYPAYSSLFDENLAKLTQQLNALLIYGQTELSDLQCREMITFHDGFAYMADCFDLTILAAIEEESGSEASAQELIELIQLVETYQLTSIFIESNGSLSAPGIIAAETGAKIFTLHMAMSGDDYFTVMYQNIDSIKEALG